jgi:hypothetical protein
MKLEMRQKLGRESFEEKIRKVGQLIRLAKNFPRRVPRPAARKPARDSR